MTSAPFTLPILDLPGRAENRSICRRSQERPSGLPRIEWIERQSKALHSSPLGADGEVLALNLARGCWHQCGFCAARAYASYPGEAVLQVYSQTPQRLEEELAGRRRLPRAVFVSPSTDPFPPSSEVQAETVRVVNVLAKHGVEAWLMTRGFIRPFALRALATQAKSVKAVVAVTTLDRGLPRVLEPGTAPPRLRLRQIASLRRAEVRVQVALDPLVPGLTDTRGNLDPLLRAVAGLGVKQVSASYLFLRPGIVENLRTALRPHGWDESVLEAYADGPILAAEGIAPARYLSKLRRQRGYAALMALAARHGLTVSVSALANPDFAPPRAASQGEAQKLLQFSAFRSLGQSTSS
jgi:DNA repair photolyase